MELLKTLFVKALSFAGFNIPDVAKDDLGAVDVDETSEERKSRFAAFADAEDEIKEDVSFRQQMEEDMDAGLYDDEGVA